MTEVGDLKEPRGRIGRRTAAKSSRDWRSGASVEKETLIGIPLDEAVGEKRWINKRR